MAHHDRDIATGEGRAPEEASSSGVVAVPALRTGSVLGGIAVLRERGQWEAVRAEVFRRDPFASHWIDRVADGAWCPLDRGIALFDALHALYGEEGARALGTTRFARSMETGVLAPMLRSWARVVAPDAVALVKLAPHLWRAGSQGLGDVRVLEARPGAARLRFTSEHPSLVSSAGFQAFLEGFVLELVKLRLGPDRGGTDREAPSDDRAHFEIVEGRAELVLSWL